MKNMMIGAAILAAATAAGSASAQFNYSGLSTMVPLSNSLSAIEGSENYSQYYFPIYDPSHITPLTTPTTFTQTLTVDNSLFTHLNSASVAGSVTAQASLTRFEATWDHQSSVSIAPGTTRDLLAVDSALNVVLTGTIGFDTNTRIRVTFNYGGDGFNPSGSPSFAKLTIGQSSSWPYGQLVIESSSPGSIPVPLVFEADVLAGQTFDFDLFATTGASNAGAQYANGWNQHSFGTLVVEVIPAPSAAALLGLGGLVAARRRRA